MSRPENPPAEPGSADHHQPEARIRLLLETVPVALLNCDRDGRIEYYNSYCARLWGRVPALDDPRERYCGSFRIYTLEGELVDVADGPMAMALKTGLPQLNQEWQLERPDGTRVIVLVNVAPHHDASGQVAGAVSCMLDITERKRIERLLLAREEEFRSIVENAVDPIGRFNRELVRTYVNPALARAHGVSKEELIGTSIGSPAGNGDASVSALGPLAEMLRSVFASGRPADVEVRWPNPERPRDFAVHLEPEFDHRGLIESVLVIARDMTERKRAEEEIRESQRLLQQVLATLPVGVVVTGPTGDILFVNASSKRIWGGDTIVDGQQRWADSKGFWHDTGKKIEPGEWASARALTQGKMFLNELVDIAAYDGQQKIILNSAAPIRNADGKITGAVIVNEDVTEQKKQEEKLRQTEAELARVGRLMMMGELTATIAHEVNQPLAAVVTNANAALRWFEQRNWEEACEAVRRIVREGERASSVIQRMRGLIRKSEPTRAPVDLNELTRETLSLMQPELARKKVSVESELALPLPRILADRVQIQQVLLNLIVNAVDSMAAVSGPRVLRITTQQVKPDEVNVAVHDTGAGIEPRDRERMFDPFYSTKPEGVGMGLAISRSIIEAHGGHISATSNEGRGATIQFSLPVEQEA